MSRNNLLLLVMVLFTQAVWAGNPLTFTYQGRLADVNGNPVTDTVSIKLQILAPNDCLLYEEVQSGLNFTTSQGNFALQVGSGQANPKRTANDPNLAMNTVFSNAGTQVRSVSSPNCALGYTPAAGDARKLRVTVINAQNTADVLSPDQVITSSPFATTAETLQGKQPGDFIQNTIAGMQLALENLVNGTSTAPLQLNNQNISNVADPVSSKDATNKQYTDSHVGGQTYNGSGLATNKVLAWSGSAWTPATMTDASVSASGRALASTCGANQASSWNGSAWICVSTGATGLVGGGATVYTPATTTINLDNTSSKVQVLNFANGGVLRLPDATTVPLGGPLFTLQTPTQEAIPIFDFNGKFIVGIGTTSAMGSAPISADIFLVNNSTAAGDWRITGTDKLTTSAVEKTIKSTLLNAPNWIGYNDQATRKFPGTNVWVLPYTVNSGNPNVMAAQIDFSAKSVSLGSPVSLGSTSYVDTVVTLNSTKAIVIEGPDAQVITLSGTAITPGTIQTGKACPNPARYIRLDNSNTLCVYRFFNGTTNVLGVGKLTIDGADNITKNLVDGPSVGSGAYPRDISILPGGTLAIAYVEDYDNGAKVFPITISSQAIGATPFQASPPYQSIGYVSGPDSTGIMAVDGSTALFVYNNYSTQYLSRLTVSAASITADAQQLMGYSYDSMFFYDDGTDTWLFFNNSLGVRHRAKVTGTANPVTFGSDTVSGDCMYSSMRADLTHCGRWGGYEESAGDFELNFKFWVTL